MSGADSLSKVSFGSSELPGYEGGDKTLPAVIVVQEWWGVTPIVKEQAAMIRDKGFRVLIPDLYKGKIGVDAEEASHMMNNLDFKAALGELQQAVDYLKDSGSPKVAIIGFCMGGAITFAAAEHVTGLTAGSAFYGLPDARLSTVDKAKVPMQAHFGALDTFKGFSDIDTAKAAEAKMQDAGLSPEFHYYPGCGHAFLNGLTEEGREKISTIGQAKPPDSEVQEAFERLITFLTKHLK